jgi:glutamyl-tRNA synthetase
MTIRVRFAPSPTGYLHVGGARTALFNWLFARHNNGTFVLRIEDTDRARSTEESIAQILEAMRWLGLNWDEYYRQTDRTEFHLRAAESLMAQNAAYEKDGAWWFRVPTEGETVVHDDLLGDVVYPNSQLKDFVIRRSDGSFVYNFVVVVDDADMGITHVIRGDDHLNNTPKQILLYHALGKPLPHFVHLPMILGPDRTRLSKRHGVTSVLEYRRRGFLPEALVNFLARLGWSHGDQEFFTRDELIELFSLDHIGKSASVFDEEKLHWLNQQHMKAADPGRLVELVAPFVREQGKVTEEMWSGIDRDRLTQAVERLRHRCKTLVDLARVLEIVFPVEIDREEEIELDDRQRELIEALIDAFSGMTEFTPEAVEQAMRETLAAHGAKLKDVGHACRMAVTGRRAGPGLFETIALIGRDITIARLRELINEE